MENLNENIRSMECASNLGIQMIPGDGSISFCIKLDIPDEFFAGFMFALADMLRDCNEISDTFADLEQYEKVMSSGEECRVDADDQYHDQVMSVVDDVIDDLVDTCTDDVMILDVILSVLREELRYILPDDRKDEADDVVSDIFEKYSPDAEASSSIGGGRSGEDLDDDY